MTLFYTVYTVQACIKNRSTVQYSTITWHDLNPFRRHGIPKYRFYQSFAAHCYSSDLSQTNTAVRLCCTQCSLLCSNIQHNLHIFYNSFSREVLLWTKILALLSRTVKTNENCFSSYLNAKRKNFKESRFPLVKGHISWREKKRNLSGITRNNWFFYFFSLRAKFYYYNHI